MEIDVIKRSVPRTLVLKVYVFEIDDTHKKYLYITKMTVAAVRKAIRR